MASVTSILESYGPDSAGGWDEVRDLASHGPSLAGLHFEQVPPLPMPESAPQEAIRRRTHSSLFLGSGSDLFNERYGLFHDLASVMPIERYRDLLTQIFRGLFGGQKGKTLGWLSFASSMQSLQANVKATGGKVDVEGGRVLTTGEQVYDPTSGSYCIETATRSMITPLPIVFDPRSGVEFTLEVPLDLFSDEEGKAPLASQWMVKTAIAPKSREIQRTEFKSYGLAGSDEALAGLAEGGYWPSSNRDLIVNTDGLPIQVPHQLITINRNYVDHSGMPVTDAIYFTIDPAYDYERIPHLSFGRRRGFVAGLTRPGLREGYQRWVRKHQEHDLIQRNSLHVLNDSWQTKHLKRKTGAKGGAGNTPETENKKGDVVSELDAVVRSSLRKKNLVEEAKDYARTKAGKDIKTDKKFLQQSLRLAKAKKHPDLATREAKEEYADAINKIMGDVFRLYDNVARCTVRSQSSHQGRYSSLLLHGYNPAKKRTDYRSFKGRKISLIVISDPNHHQAKDLATAEPI